MSIDPTLGEGDESTTTERPRQERQSTHSERRSEQGFDRDQAERQARDAIGNARDELRYLIENQKNAAVAQVQEIAEALHRTADELRRKDQKTVATYVTHVADRIEHWSGRLRERHIDSLARDMQQFASRQPGLVIAGAVVLGFVATRFLKSSDNVQRGRAGDTPARDSHPGEGALAGPETSSSVSPTYK